MMASFCIAECELLSPPFWLSSMADNGHFIPCCRLWVVLFSFLPFIYSWQWWVHSAQEVSCFSLSSSFHLWLTVMALLYFAGCGWLFSFLTSIYADSDGFSLLCSMWVALLSFRLSSMADSDGLFLLCSGWVALSSLWLSSMGWQWWPFSALQDVSGSPLLSGFHLWLTVMASLLCRMWVALLFLLAFSYCWQWWPLFALQNVSGSPFSFGFQLLVW